MDRSKMISQLEDPSEVFDFLVIGGGATGIGPWRCPLFGARRCLLGSGSFARTRPATPERSPFGKRSNLLNPLLSLVGRPVLYDRPDPI